MAAIPEKERKFLRELAQQQRAYSALPVMEERRTAWTLHNDLKSNQPMIHFETRSCEEQLLPPLACISEEGRWMEKTLRRAMLNHEMIQDDRVVPGTFDLTWHIDFQLFNMPPQIIHADENGQEGLGQHFLPLIRNLERDVETLAPSQWSVDRRAIDQKIDMVQDVLGDILPVRLKTGYLGASLTQNVVMLMGMEAMLFALMDHPEPFSRLMGRITDEYLRYYQWLEKNGLLIPNNDDFFVNQGTFGFTDELPQGKPGTPTGLQDMWFYMDSQETVTVSPAMYETFFFPHYRRLAEPFGRLNYGCCEPVHLIWDRCVSRLPGLRKVSISPWCDEAFMGERLRGSSVIYHRKPSPLFVGLGGHLDEDGFRKHIRETIHRAKGCRLEFSFRDVYDLGGHPEKPARAVQIVREELADLWT